METEARKILAYALSVHAAEIVMRNYREYRAAPAEWMTCTSMGDFLPKEFARKLRRMLVESGLPVAEWPAIFHEATLHERIVTSKLGTKAIWSYLCSVNQPDTITLAAPIHSDQWNDAMYDERDDESNFYSVQSRNDYPELFNMKFRKVTLKEFCVNYGIDTPFEKAKTPRT